MQVSEVSGFERLLEQDRETLLTASIIVYAGVYLVLGVGGISFQAQPAAGYVQDTGNSCQQGSIWVENAQLHWCEGSEHYAYDAGSNDNVGLVDGTSPDPSGSVWVNGQYFYWVDSGDDEYRYQGIDTGNNPGDPSGSVWVENNYIHYIDENGNERTISRES